MRMGRVEGAAICYRARGDADADRDCLTAVGKKANAMLERPYRPGGTA